MQTNRERETPKLFTHEGAPATRAPSIAMLRRSVLSCLLWENEFYEDGQEIGARIQSLVHLCRPKDVAALAIEARELQHLRHIPLLLLRELVRHPAFKEAVPTERTLVSDTIARVIQRADEIAEFMALYWKDGKTPIARQVKRGLSLALTKFDEYQLAKYDREKKSVRLRDVMFMTHSKPSHEARFSHEFTVSPGIARENYKRGDTLRHLGGQGALWFRLAQQKLQTPDTWEVALSSGADKKQTFERLIREGKLGYLALLRNLRNMVEAGCDLQSVRDAIALRKGAQRVLPFRFIAAARHAAQLEPELDAAMVASMQELGTLPGRTVILVDNSGSMYKPLSEKSDLRRADAAAGVAIFARGIAEQVRVFAFSDTLQEVPPRVGMALRDAIKGATDHGGTRLGYAVNSINSLDYDRLIVITDEQSSDVVPAPKGRGYMINVASAKNGVGYRSWVHIDGWSEQVVRFIQEYEATNPIKI